MGHGDGQGGIHSGPLESCMLPHTSAIHAMDVACKRIDELEKKLENSNRRWHEMDDEWRKREHSWCGQNTELKNALDAAMDLFEQIRRKSCTVGYDSGDSGIEEIANKGLTIKRAGTYAPTKPPSNPVPPSERPVEETREELIARIGRQRVNLENWQNQVTDTQRKLAEENILRQAMEIELKRAKERILMFEIEQVRSGSQAADDNKKIIDYEAALMNVASLIERTMNDYRVLDESGHIRLDHEPIGVDGIKILIALMDRANIVLGNKEPPHEESH